VDGALSGDVLGYVLISRTLVLLDSLSVLKYVAFLADEYFHLLKVYFELAVYLCYSCWKLICYGGRARTTSTSCRIAC